MKSNDVYFPNLNGVRAIAAFMVVFFHIELIKSEFKYGSIVSRIELGGDMGVILFFVLSGFLITYLLLQEESTTKKISLRNFYTRRILRIWPLYFFVVLICLFVLPHIPFMYEPPYRTPVIHSRIVVICLYIFLAANVLTGLYSHVNFIRPTWSVSVEEQFYLFWPVLLKYSKNRVKTIRNVFFTYWLLRIVFSAINTDLFSRHFPALTPLRYLDDIWYYTPLDALSIGAFTAYILHTKRTTLLNALFHKGTQLIVFIGIPLLIYVIQFQGEISLFGFRQISCTTSLLAVIFAIGIINLAGNKNVIISLENKIMYHLGKISYGLYLYHWIIIIAVINLLRRYFPLNNNIVIFNIALYVLTVSFTILTAHLSYTLFESKFIALKKKFSSVISGDLVKDKV